MARNYDLRDKVAIVTGGGRGIVGSVLFLCSEDSAYITGTTIYVDGGSLAN